MSAYDVKQLKQRLDGFEGQVLAIKDTVSDALYSAKVFEERSIQAHTDFVDTIQSSISSSIDIAKAKLMEDIKAYIDQQIQRASDETNQRLAKLSDDISSLRVTVATMQATATAVAPVTDI
jgi:DNA-binding FrmR family transcriptional regulator